METCKYLSKSEQQRFKNILYEIEDLMNSLKCEVSKDKSYKSYLQEKLNGINTDIKCLNSIAEYKDSQ